MDEILDAKMRMSDDLNSKLNKVLDEFFLKSDDHEVACAVLCAILRDVIMHSGPPRDRNLILIMKTLAETYLEKRASRDAPEDKTRSFSEEKL